MCVYLSGERGGGGEDGGSGGGEGGGGDVKTETTNKMSESPGLPGVASPLIEGVNNSIEQTTSQKCELVSQRRAVIADCQRDRASVSLRSRAQLKRQAAEVCADVRRRRNLLSHLTDVLCRQASGLLRASSTRSNPSRRICEPLATRTRAAILTSFDPIHVYTGYRILFRGW